MIPGARNVDHYAFTVPDLAEAVEFFVDVLGADLAYRIQTVSDSGDFMREQLDVDSKATASIAMLRLGPTTNIELFEYSAPEQSSAVPCNDEIGGHHLAFWVEDVDAAVRYLERQPGVTVLGAPMTMPEHMPNAGDRWVYFLTPWGMSMEVHHVPSGMPYERQTDLRRYGPCDEWHNGRSPRLATRGIPTARNVDHVGYTVPDLDEAVFFFTEVLGAREVLRLGPWELGQDFMRQQLNIPRGGMQRQALLRIGPTDNIELFEYATGAVSRDVPRNSDVGGHHLAFYVDNVPRAAEYLAEQEGVTILGEPQRIQEGPIAGDTFVYFRSPWGMYLELINLPDGSLPYEEETECRRRPASSLWHC